MVALLTLWVPTKLVSTYACQDMMIDVCGLEDWMMCVGEKMKKDEMHPRGRRKRCSMESIKGYDRELCPEAEKRRCAKTCAGHSFNHTRLIFRHNQPGKMFTPRRNKNIRKKAEVEDEEPAIEPTGATEGWLDTSQWRH